MFTNTHYVQREELDGISNVKSFPSKGKIIQTEKSMFLFGGILAFEIVLSPSTMTLILTKISQECQL